MSDKLSTDFQILYINNIKGLKEFTVFIRSRIIMILIAIDKIIYI